MRKIVRRFHTDHGVPESTLLWAVEQLPLSLSGLFVQTFTIPADAPDLTNNLYGPASGDPPVLGEVMIRDGNDASRGATPFVNLPPRPTRLLTVIGIANGEEVTLFTYHGGPAAERIPSDPGLVKDPEGQARARRFWSQHALSVAAKK